MGTSKPLEGIEWANYPLACRESFLARSRQALTASEGAKRHFIYPDCDSILDAYNWWLELNSAPEPEVPPL